MAENFYTILTSIGKSKLANSTVLGNKINLKVLQVGDGNGTYHEPSEAQTCLINKVWENDISSISVDEVNSNWIVIQTIIPATDGGFYIREAGIFDEEGDLIAVSKVSETYKPVISEGSAKDVSISIVLEVSNVDNITLNIDPNVVVATKNDIEVLETEMQGINMNVSDIEKIKANQSDLDVTNANLMIKANDTDSSRTTTSKTVTGAINELNSGKASLMSPAFTGTPTAPTQLTTDNSTKIATTAFINNLLSSIASSLVFANDSTYAFRGIKGAIADNDYWRVGGGGTASDTGYLEIATADNGNEPIYIRQYNGVFTNVNRTLTLLDGSGNSMFPGTIANSVSSDAILQLENTVSPTTAFRLKRIYSSNNVANGNAILFRQIRPSDGAIIDYQLGTGSESANTAGFICTTVNEPLGSGYKKFADGLIIQWGTASSINGVNYVTYNIAFPNACSMVMATANDSGQCIYPPSSWIDTSNPKTQFGLRDNYSHGIWWFAVGY